VAFLEQRVFCSNCKEHPGSSAIGILLSKDFSCLVMLERRGWYIRSAVHSAKHINRTKYLLTLITIICTITAVFLIRVNLSENGAISTLAKTVFWLLNSTCGFFLIAYPWWLTTRNSFLYFKRLEWSCVGVALIVYVLVCARTILAPVEHINNTDPSITSLSFRVVSSLYWVAMLGGFFLFMPFMIRRHRLFNSGRTQLALGCFVFPCVLLALSSVMLQEWTGNGYLVSSSPVILIVLYYAVKIAHALFNDSEANGVEFNEAYIIVAGKRVYVSNHCVVLHVCINCCDASVIEFIIYSSCW
jgi:hypothetical protein